MVRFPASLFFLFLSCVQVANAAELEEIQVLGSQQRVVLEKDALHFAAPDTAAMMKAVPGGNVNSNGALSGIAQYRGMFGPRVHVVADGTAISPGGPNWMDPPLHYVPAALLERFTVFRGIAPVSAGQETIGGVVSAETWQGAFADSARWSSQGRAYAGAQSNNDAAVGAIAAALANDRHKLRGALLREQGNDQHAADATLLPTEYRRERYDAGYAMRLGGHEIRLDASRSRTDDSGNPALPMDTLYIDGDHQTLRWTFRENGWHAEARLSRGNIEHGMTNYHLRPSPGLSAWRRNDAGSDSWGARFSIGRGAAGAGWLLGLDHHRSDHESDISNPNNTAFYVRNFDGVERELSGVFAEGRVELAQAWQLELGVRANLAKTDAETVDASMAVMSAGVAALRDGFNRSERAQRDELYDAVAKLQYSPREGLVFHGGAARKSRAPAYQERYLWLPMQATAGLADGNNHVGDPDLLPEVAHEIETGFDLDRGNLWLSPRLFYRHVDDYIQGVPAGDPTVIMVSTMMGGDSTPLSYANTRARFYGADLEFQWRFAAHWSLGGIASVVRGERRDIDDWLYRTAPDNATLSLHRDAGPWRVSLQAVLTAEQDRVSDTNEEQSTAGYGLLNLHGSYRAAETVTIALGINNLLDRDYADHLGGYNRAVNPNIPLGERLPGPDRDVFARLRFEW